MFGKEKRKENVKKVVLPKEVVNNFVSNLECQKLNNEENKKCNEFATIDEMLEAKTIRPIIFTKTGNCMEKSLSDAPFDFVTSCAVDTVRSNSLEGLKDSKNSKLIIHNLDRLAISNIEKITKNYILQNSFASIANCFNSKIFSIWFTNIPILEDIYNSLFSIQNRILYDKMRTLFSYTRTYTTSHLENQNDIAASKSMILNMDKLIVSEIYNEICSVVNKTIDYSIYIDNKVDVISLYNHISTINGDNKCDDIKFYVASILKKQALDVINEVTFTSIGPLVTMILNDVAFTSFYVYDDFKHYELNDKDYINDIDF